MRIFGFHILTDKQLGEKLEAAKTEQRRLNISMMEKLTYDNVVLSHVVKNGRDKKSR